MIGRTIMGPAAVALAVGVAGAWAPPAAGEARGGEKALRIGMIGSLFRDLPAPLARASVGPFRTLVESQTGLRAQVERGGDAFSLGRRLHSGELELAVFHGFEFAWAREKYPDLRPLLIAINQRRRFHAHILVRANCPARGLAGLKGKTLAFPRHSWEHCYLFLERACREAGKKVREYFARVTTPDSVEDALDDVVDGKADAALVDSVSLERYQDRKPGRYARLREAVKSVAFPAAVVAYRPGAVDEETLSRFRRGLLNARQTAFGRQLLTLWRLTGFEEVPSGYGRSLKAIARRYPPPGHEAMTKKDSADRRRHRLTSP